MPFRWRGVSALSWIADERTSLELGHVPRLAVFSTHSAVCYNTLGFLLASGYSDYGFALSAAPESVSALYEAWKSNTLTRSLLRDFSGSRLDSFFESRGLARNTVLLFSLLSPACKFLESRRAARCP